MHQPCPGNPERLRLEGARAAVALGALALTLTACSDSGQDPTADADPSSADGATADVTNTRFDTIAQLSFEGLTTPGPTAPVAVSSSLDRIAVGIRGVGEIFIFDGDGQMVRSFGRSGQGPGEYNAISQLLFHPTTDSLWVLDRGNGRISVIAPGADRPAREIPLRGRFHGAAWASDSRLFVQGEFPGRISTTGDVYGVAIDGDSIIAVAAAPITADMDDFGAGRRPVTSSAEGGLWVAHFRRPELQRLGPDLNPLSESTYEARFFAGPPENADIWSAVIDAEPAVLGITEQQPGGALWIVFGVPADPLPRVEDPMQALSSGEVETSDLATTILARFDADALASGPVEEVEWCPLRVGLLPNGLAYCFSTDPMGEAEITLVRLVS